MSESISPDIVSTVATIEMLRDLPIRAMVAVAVRSARRVLPDYRVPIGHEDAKSAPRHLKTGLVLAEQFCLGQGCEGDMYARRVGMAQVAAERAAYAAQAVPKILANLPKLAD